MKVYILMDSGQVVNVFESYDDACIAAVYQREGEYGANVYIRVTEVIPAK